MKALMIFLFITIIITLISIISISIYVYRPYTKKDIDRVLDIYLERDKANLLDYLRLDVNRDEVIDLLDGVIIINEVNK